MAKKVKIGIIGMSEGNGHPYSWSAIFNGYNPEEMKRCPFPAIPDYLGKQKFPEDGLGNLGEVTHIWTQDKTISKHIAKASKIENIVDTLPEMAAKVDVVLLARDDAEHHFRMASPFLKAGLPIFIDKPLALSEREGAKIFEAQKYENQIFTCSSMRYAKELQLTEEEGNQLGEIQHVEGSVPKCWDTYAVHLIEPIIAQLPNRGKLETISSFEKNGIHFCFIIWKNVTAFLKVTGDVPAPYKIEFFGEKGSLVKNSFDSFSCFKNSLESFIHSIEDADKNIDRSETAEIIRILEMGRK